MYVESPKQRLRGYFQAASSPPFWHVRAGYAPALCAGHYLLSIAWSNHTELLKRMLIDTRDTSLLRINIGMFSARMVVSLVICPVAPAPDHGSLSESLSWAWY